MLVNDLMTPVEKMAVVTPMTTVRNAMQTMKKNALHTVVIEKNGPAGAYGLLTYKNLLSSVVAEEGDIDLLHVYDIANIPALSISGMIDVRYAAKLMIQNDIKRLLVTQNNELRGIIAMTDIMAYVIDNVSDFEG